MNYLLDTNVVVSALRSRRGASHALLRRSLEGRLSVVMHHKLLMEYRDVLSRAEILSALVFSWEDIEKILTRLAWEAQEIRVSYLWRPNLRDEGDNFLLGIAIAAAPCTLMTHNLADFRNGQLLFPGVWLKTPQQALFELAH